MSRPPFPRDATVRHPALGLGTVRSDLGETVLVRFETNIEECPATELELVASIHSAMEGAELAPPLTVLTRVLAEAVRSVNDAWGVFSRSRIALLPHQLWVCRQVNRSVPTRMLVADDVGLGKTIEAGLILSPLLGSGTVQRLLILCPASLVPQWQLRMRTMFDIRLTVYLKDADTPKSDYWNSNPMVVASLHTLRDDRRDRHERLLASEPWDMVLVDEAHHLYADEEEGARKGYQLIDKLERAQRIRSMVFFTGTPHRGKDYGFLALLQLLRPDLFDPKKSMAEQLPKLREVMIRNNKHEVTDLAGKRLFQEPVVKNKEYSYSPAEKRFYDMLTEFIVTGKAYARSLGQADGRAVMLVLIALQKLASSSVAAIRRAIRGRLVRTEAGVKHLEELQRQMAASESEDDEDSLNDLEEQVAAQTDAVILMKDELPRLQEILAAANAVTEETKITTILGLLDGPFHDRPVLFFTEYKATQSLLLSKLFEKFGAGCATFINGDERADDVVDAHGRRTSLMESRERAAEKFNAGQVRFLISTEAGGEGIDLQENCHSLIHVDLPWNPMRMQQRVGRLNRYGQKRQVEVYTIRNPDTVESRIWMHLNAKIERIMKALGSVMKNPEDMLQFVLGMASPSLFRELYSEAGSVPPEDVTAFFDSKTRSFGGQGAVETVRNLVGNVAKFDFQESGEQIPKLDLPQLKPFFKAALQFNKRKVAEENGGVDFKTPEPWLQSPGIRKQYHGMSFERQADRDKILGVGQKLVDLALEQARDIGANATVIYPGLLKGPTFICRVTDKVTTHQRNIRFAIVALESRSDGWQLMRDWQLILKVNELLATRDPRRYRATCGLAADEVTRSQRLAEEYLSARLDFFDLPFDLPRVETICVLLPGETIDPNSVEAEET